MFNSITIKHRQYKQAEVEQILVAYRTLFPQDDITSALRTYWGWGRPRQWSYVTTDFHAATYDRLLALHQSSMEVEKRWRAGELTQQAKGEELVAAARRNEVGYSIGVNPWTDNLLWRTFDPGLPRQDLVVIVGHDWYPIGAGDDPESPMLDQGLHHTERYRTWCPESFFRQQKNDPVILFLNLFPDFRVPGARKTGRLSTRKGYLSYAACMDGLKEVLRIVSPKFERTSVISWGSEAWQAMSPLVDGEPVSRGIKDQQKLATGKLLRVVGTPYFPMAHPSFGTNHSKQHLRVGYAAMGLGKAEFDVQR